MNNSPIPSAANSLLQQGKLSAPKSESEGLCGSIKWITKLPLKGATFLVDKAWNGVKAAANGAYKALKNSTEVDEEHYLYGSSKAFVNSTKSGKENLEKISKTAFKAVGEGIHRLQKSSTETLKKAKELAEKPIVLGIGTVFAKNINPISHFTSGEADRTLRDIAKGANTGLNHAEAAGVIDTTREFSTVVTELETRINQRLAQIDGERSQKQIKSDDEKKLSELPPSVSEAVQKSEITLAPNLKAKVETIQWDKKIESYSVELTDKLTAYATLIKLRDLCGLEGADDNRDLLELAGVANKEGQTKSVWKLFNEHYKDKEISWFQKIKAGLFYWFFHNTSLISKTIKAYLKASIVDSRKSLKDSESRSKFFQTIIKNASQFLEKDIGATHQYAHGAAEDLSSLRNEAIEKIYDSNLRELCKKYSVILTNKPNLNIEILNQYKWIPVLKFFIYGFEYFVNFIIQKYVQKYILPPALESSVVNVNEATQPHNLPFSIAITEFITEKLEQLSVHPMEETESPEPLPGTEGLEPMVDHLLSWVEMHSHTTREDLLSHFDKSKRNLNENIKIFLTDNLLGRREKIKKGLVEAFQHLFDVLDKKARSEELFARPLQLACKVFDKKFSDLDELKLQYQEQKEKLVRVFDSTVKDIIDNIAQRTLQTNPLKIEEDTQHELKKQKAVTEEVIQCLDELTSEMIRKVNLSDDKENPETNIQTEIATIFQVLKIFSNRKDLQEEIKHLRGVDKQTIWNTLNPAYLKIFSILQRVLEIQDFQNHHTAHFGVKNNIQELQTNINKIAGEFKRDPLHGRILLNTFLQEKWKQLDHIINKKSEEKPKIEWASEVRKINEYTLHIDKLSSAIAKEEEVLVSLSHLSPIKEKAVGNQNEGLIETLISIERGIPTDKTTRVCLDQIAKHLKALRTENTNVPSEEERRVLDLIGNGKNLAAKWSKLSETLQQIYNIHANQKAKLLQQFDSLLEEISVWGSKVKAFHEEIHKIKHKKMVESLDSIKKDLSEERTFIRERKANTPFNIPILEAGLPAMGLWAVYQMSNWVDNPLWRYIVVPSIALAGYFGKDRFVNETKKGITSGIKSFVHSKIKDMAQTVHTKIQEPEIYKGTFTRLMHQQSSKTK